jgi:hypothetical protein
MASKETYFCPKDLESYSRGGGKMRKKRDEE